MRMNMNSNMDKYSVTLKEYEDSVFEHIALHGLFYLRVSDWEIDDERNELNGSGMYREWVKNYAWYYRCAPIYSKYIDSDQMCVPIDLDNEESPIYLTKFEWEQILSILTTEYIVTVLNNKERSSFGDSLGVRYVKETFFTYYASNVQYTTSNLTCSGRPSIPDFNLKKWSEQKLMATYGKWLDGLVIGDPFSIIENFMGLKNSYPSLEQDFELNFSANYYSDDTYFTPRIVKSLLEDLKDILEKNPDTSETDSRDEVLNFIMDVFIKVTPDWVDEDRRWRGNWKDLNADKILDMFQLGIKIYSEESVFNKKDWIKKFCDDVISAIPRTSPNPVGRYFPN